MEALECILERRSIRRYKSDQVSEEDLNVVLEAFRWAPSWANTQCWELVVVRDTAMKEKLQSLLPPVNPARPALTKAPVVIAICGKTGKSGFYKESACTLYGDWMLFDLGIAAQNLCLAAHSLGLGTVHVGLFDHAQAGKVLGLPDDIKVVELIPLGHPERRPDKTPRRETADFVHRESYGRGRR